MSEEEEQNRFSLRKLSIGLASVLVGVSIFGTSQTVKADTVVNNQTSSVISNAQSSDTQENKNVAKSSFSNDNQANNAKSNLIQTQVEGKNEQKQDSAPKTQEVNDGSNLDAEKDIVRTGSLQELDNQSNNHAEDNSQTRPQTSQKLDLTKNSKKFAKKVLATNLIATPPMTNGGFDEATWGKLDVNNWQGQAVNGVYQLTNYTGDPNHVIIPNEADFEQAGKSTNGLQVGISSSTAHSLLLDQEQMTIAFSKTSDQKVKAIGTNWSNAFSVDTAHLSKFDGSNLDVSSITNMSNMFTDNLLSDLTSLKNWDTSKVTDMHGMFNHNSISDLTPLKNWDTSKVTNMSEMFKNNKVSDLTPLKNWDTSNVTNMSFIFYRNSISDLTPLKNWKTTNITDMSYMFTDNQISNLIPLANWSTSKVTDMNNMLSGNSISDLTPLANWDTSKVTNMSAMFSVNSISNLSPLTHWKTSNVTDMSTMFVANSISNLTPLAHWDTSKVTNMSYMFWNNRDLSDLSPIAKWNISGTSLFRYDTKLNLTNIKNNDPLMLGFLKDPDALRSATFITNNADLVKATTGQELPTITNTATRTILFKFPDSTSNKITQTIYYKTIAPVQIYYNNREIVKTYPVKESDWQLDDSKPNDAIIVNGKIHFKSVKIPHINGYKAHLVRNKINPAMLMVSFMAVPSEVTPSTPVEETPSKPSAPSDSQFTELDHKVVDVLNQSDSGWTMPENNSTYTVEVPDDAIIDLSDLVIAEPVHAQTRVKLAVTKHFKLSKKHVAKHLKHRKKAVKSFKKYRL